MYDTIFSRLKQWPAPPGDVHKDGGGEPQKISPPEKRIAHFLFTLSQ